MEALFSKRRFNVSSAGSVQAGVFRFSTPPPGMVSFQYITSKTGPVIINLTALLSSNVSANCYLESANNLQAKVWSGIKRQFLQSFQQVIDIGELDW